MLLAAAQIQRELGRVRFVISQAPSVDKNIFNAIISSGGGAVDHRVSTDHVREVFKACRLVVAVSGTVTLEAAIWGTPTVIMYKLSPVSYWLGKALVKVDHVGLVNLILRRRLFPELIQQEASPDNIASVVLDLLKDNSKLETIKAGLVEARGILGKAGASSKVAEIALGLLNDRDDRQ